jgi:hypothetical protein
MPNSPKPYAGLKASLLTQHGKESVICPQLFDSNGLEVVHVSGYDTDNLGTFTRDIPRYGSQLDAARKKARVGMELSGLKLGIASEGAFDNDPHTGMFSWNYELVILIDDHRDIEIVGFFGGLAQSASRQVSSWDEVNAFLSVARFNTHQLVIRPDDENHPESRKGVKDLETLKMTYEWAKRISKNGNVFIENDLRAHTNPTRMANILKATEDLSRKMNSLCPECELPGFWVTERKKGLPCSSCEEPTNLPIAYIWSCVKCECKKEIPIPNQTKADPMKCDYCNP